MGSDVVDFLHVLPGLDGESVESVGLDNLVEDKDHTACLLVRELDGQFAAVQTLDIFKFPGVYEEDVREDLVLDLFVSLNGAHVEEIDVIVLHPEFVLDLAT